MMILKNTHKFQKNVLIMCAVLLAMLATVATYYNLQAANSVTIQAEDFDWSTGPKSVVDKQLGYITNGDNTRYEVNILQDSSNGKIKVTLRVASGGGGGEIRFHASNGGFLGTVDVSNTGGWRTYKTITAEIDAPSQSGQQNLTLFYSGGRGYLFDIDYFTLTFDDAAEVFDTNDKIQAEAYREASANVKIVQGRGSGAAVGYIRSSASTEYNLEIKSTGKADIDLRVTSPRGDAYIIIKVDGGTVGKVDVPDTGGWDDFRTITTELNIPSYLQDRLVDLRLEYHSNDGYSDKDYLMDIDYIKLDYSN